MSSFIFLWNNCQNIEPQRQRKKCQKDGNDHDENVLTCEERTKSASGHELLPATENKHKSKKRKIVSINGRKKLYDTRHFKNSEEKE